MRALPHSSTRGRRLLAIAALTLSARTSGSVPPASSNMTASFTQAVLTPPRVRGTSAASRIDPLQALQIDVTLDDGRVVPLRLADARQVHARIADIAAWLPQLASVTLRKRSR